MASGHRQFLFSSGEGQTPGPAQAVPVLCPLAPASTQTLGILAIATVNFFSWVTIQHQEGILWSPVTDLVLGSG